MCGRTACALCPENVQKACSYRDKRSGKFQQPRWGNNPKNKQQYVPSHNIAPTDVTPVLVSGMHFSDEATRMLQPMMWGMVPRWHKGDHKSHGLTTNNCRYETLLSSKLYASPFNKGNRCVVICDGFYEWQTTKGKGSKQPYFIYMSQDEGVRVEDAATWSSDWNEEDGWKGPKLLHMAGIFDVWNTPEGDQIYSYSVITLESNDTLSWLHHRMPAILEGDQQVADWLDVKRVQAQEAAAMIHPVPKVLSWHAVATLVNNSRNKDPQCNKPITLEKPKPSKGQMLMQSWLKKGTVKRESQEVRDDMPDDGSGDGSLAVKKVKTDT